MKISKKEVKIKNSLFLILSVVLIFNALSSISATSTGCCIGSECYTFVEGVVYYEGSEIPVPGAELKIKCEDKNRIARTSIEKTTTNENGEYSVSFCQTSCNEKDKITITASKDGIKGSAIGIVDDKSMKYIDIAILNVALVPEFTGIIAGLTILGALGAFLIVRKR